MDKNTSPDLKFDSGKNRLDLIDPSFILRIGRVLTFGANKYEDNSWKQVPDAVNRYYAAAMRHLMAYRDGEVLDQESGLPHLAHAACNIMFLMHFTYTANKDVDNV